MKRYNPPSYYISQYIDEWGETRTVNANGSGYVSFSMRVFKTPTATTPTSYVWSVPGAAPCDRYYLYPSGAVADINVYFTGQSGGMFRIECKAYNGSTLLGTAYCYVNVYP